MTYSYTQIAQYLRCPRSYRYRYLDGWKEKDSRATLLFGRAFEQALGAYFRMEISRPSRNMQIKLVRSLPNGNDFVAYIDAIGELDGNRCLLEWKTTTSRYPEEPNGLLALDPQLVCYSWMSGISDVALVAFVRKRFSEIQYLKTTITDQHREEFGRMVEATASHIEAGEFLQHSGIRFPQNGCISCPQLGLCLGNQQLVESKLVRRPGASDFDWLDQLVD